MVSELGLTLQDFVNKGHETCKRQLRGGPRSTREAIKKDAPASL